MDLVARDQRYRCGGGEARPRWTEEGFLAGPALALELQPAEVQRAALAYSFGGRCEVRALHE